MQTYAVHLYTQVRVKVTGIQAETMEEAMDKAESQVDLHDLLGNKAIRASKYDLGGGVEVEAMNYSNQVARRLNGVSQGANPAAVSS